MKSILFLIVFVIFNLNRVSDAVCKSTNNCVSYFGTTYDIESSGATYIASKITPTTNYDQSPCCDLCSRTPGCGLYEFEFINMNCSVYMFPSELKDNYGYTRYLKGGNNRTIGFSYASIGLFS